jgi:hypothetical protein
VLLGRDNTAIAAEVGHVEVLEVGAGA